MIKWNNSYHFYYYKLVDKLISNDDYAHVLSPEYPQAVDDFELFRRQHEKILVFWINDIMPS